MDTCWGESLKRDIAFISQGIATELLFNDHRCVGCIIFKQKEGEFIRILAKATVLATGGSGQVFKVTTNCRQNTGDGLALILQAGLGVMDPEAVQFHPTGIVGPGILASETLRSVGGILRNRDKHAFMERYAPKMKELAPRDLVSRAIASEIRDGRGILNLDHNVEHIWIDLRHLPDAVHDQQIPEVTGFFKKYLNLDPKKCAAASFHGFNRLGTNSLLELITMGKFVGDSVLTYLTQLPQKIPEAESRHSVSQFKGYLEARAKDNIGRIRDAMCTRMTENVGIFRTKEGIERAIAVLKELKERADKTALSSKSLRMNQELIQHWELDNLLITSMAVAQGALNRQESRGAHFREDFPERRDAFNYHTLVSMKQFGKVEFSKRNVDMSILEEDGEFAEKFGIIERKY
jgi:succinate dehydrogenase / fumarate reductase flavoprotein subunit